MKELAIYQVDVFTKDFFKGNPAAVCVLDKEIDEETMKDIAAEMNLSETAFLLPLDKVNNIYSLRWFTPEVEVDLCGHGTIGTAKVLYEIMGIESDSITFKTKSGDLIAKKYDDGIGIDMPLDNYEDFIPNSEMLSALGINQFKTAKIGRVTRKAIIQVENEAIIRNLKPNFEVLRNTKSDVVVKGVGITTINCEGYDFLTRYFNPWAGINEDPVTGTVHTVLARYWGEILQKKEMIAYQASKRGGKLILKILDDDRLEIVGDAVITLKGQICTK